MTARRPSPEPSAARVLLAGSGAVAVVVALASVAALVRTSEVARLRDLRLLARGRTLLDAAAPELLARLPEILHVPFDLERPASLATFAALAIAAHLALAWTCAAVIAPLALPWGRRMAADARRPAAYPLAVIALSLLPLVLHRLSLWMTAPTVVLVGASIVATGLAWLVATRVAGSRAAAARIAALATALTAAGVATALAGIAAHAARARPNVAGPLPPPETPNVVLISIDTLRPDHLGGYGYPRDTSPALDALAAAGARFTTAVSPTSWTLPAHATLLTALPPEVHGVVDDALRLGAATVTLAEILRARGYATAGFVSGPYLDAGYGFARGFDHYDDWSAVRLSRPAVHRARTSPALFGAVEQWLGGWQDGPAPRRPFFAFIHAWDVHYDFDPPPPYDTLFDPDYAGTIDGLDFETSGAVHAGMPARDLAHVVALYDGEIRYVDDWIGRLVASLRRRALLDDTIVVVTSDHGEEFFEHGMKGHRNALYEESIRVPLIIRHPARIRAGTVVDRQVRLMDVAPTILDLTATPLPPTFGLPPSTGAYAGRSLVPLLDGRDANASSPPSFASLQPHAQSAIRHETRKLILTPFAATTEQLFDLGTDPGERANLAAADPTSRDALRGELAAWHDAARAAAQNAEAATMSEDHEAALRALGYIE